MSLGLRVSTSVLGPVTGCSECTDHSFIINVKEILQQWKTIHSHRGGFFCKKLVPVDRTVLGVLVKLNCYIHTSLLGGLASKSTRLLINCYSPTPKKDSNVTIYIYQHMSRSQWPCSLRRRSAAARLLRLWVRILPGSWMFVCCDYCMLSGRGLCDELITRPEESYRLWCVVVCDLESFMTEEALVRVEPQGHKINTNMWT